jgi:hypothetical protein
MLLRDCTTKIIEKRDAAVRAQRLQVLNHKRIKKEIKTLPRLPIISSPVCKLDMVININHRHWLSDIECNELRVFHRHF